MKDTETCVFVGFVLFRFHFVDFVSFRFVFVDFVSFRFVSFSLISFRFVSFLFRFALDRYPNNPDIKLVIKSFGVTAKYILLLFYFI